MNFVDKLKMMPTESAIKDKAFKKAFDSDVQEAHRAIRAACIKQRVRRHVSGYVMRYRDREYGVEWFEAPETLLKPFRREVTEVSRPYELKKGHRWSALTVSERSHDSGEPLSKSAEICEQYRRAVIPLLQKDGFSSIRLSVKPVYAVYDEFHARKGILKDTYWKERVETKDLFGYTIYFEIDW